MIGVFLETERVVLRRFTEDDVPMLVELDADPEVMRFLTGGKPTPPEVIKDVVLPRILDCYGKFTGYGYWAAIEKGTGEFLGWFEFRPKKEASLDEIELGYRLRRAAWGKGYATEVARALIQKGFTELGAQRIVAETMAINTASRRVMEKAGLKLVRTFYPAWSEPIEGAEQGEVEYALERSEWDQLGSTLSH